jgi:Co/Zn/Cd efflux system component
MRSAWICSRNDVFANGAILLAAGGVAVTGAAWPDMVVGLAIAALFTGSAVGVLRDARHALRFRPQSTGSAALSSHLASSSNDVKRRSAFAHRPKP